MKTFNAVAVGEPAPRTADEGRPGLSDGGCETWVTTGFVNASEFEVSVVEGRVGAVRCVFSNTKMSRVA